MFSILFLIPPLLPPAKMLKMPPGRKILQPVLESKNTQSTYQPALSLSWALVFFEVRLLNCIEDFFFNGPLKNIIVFIFDCVGSSFIAVRAFPLIAV